MVDLEMEFFAPARRGLLRLPKCPGCHQWWWYPTDLGPCCGNDYEWVRLSGSGRVFTLTEVHRQFVPDTDVPYKVGLVVPDAAPQVRLVAGLDPETEIDDWVRLTGVSETEVGSHLVFTPVTAGTWA